MQINMHPHVKLVAEFMQREIPLDELQAVAEAMPAVAAAIWPKYEGPGIRPMKLSAEPLGGGD